MFFHPFQLWSSQVGRRRVAAQLSEHLLPCHPPLPRRDRKTSCQKSIAPAPLATGKENTGAVTPAWQEEGMEPGLWTPSRSLCEQQPHTLPCSRKWHLFPIKPWERTANIP